jgi:hypothetical protein
VYPFPSSLEILVVHGCEWPAWWFGEVFQYFIKERKICFKLRAVTGIYSASTLDPEMKYVEKDMEECVELGKAEAINFHVLCRSLWRLRDAVLWCSRKARDGGLSSDRRSGLDS